MPEHAYNAVHCKICGAECHAITEAYLEHGLCAKCFRDLPTEKVEVETNDLL